MVEVICEASVSQLSKLKSCRRAPPLLLRSQDGARLGRVVSIVLHCIFLPFAVRHPGTFSALSSAGSVSVKVSARSAQVFGNRQTEYCITNTFTVKTRAQTSNTLLKYILRKT